MLKWNNQIVSSIFVLVLTGLLALLVVHMNDTTAAYKKQADACAERFTVQSDRINCWVDDVLRTAVTTEGLEVGFNIFSYIYQEFPDFSDTGCHLHAHRMGDIAYYTNYLADPDLTQMTFPKNSIACGYGFYHGFIEHMIQDRPQIEFMEKQCSYLTEALVDIAPGLQSICYHAGGHGFMMARADELRRPEEWTIANFTTPPLNKCDALNTDNAYLKQECRQGVYNVFVNWMEVGEYGITYKPDAPYEYCDTLENTTHQYDCYVEMTRKVEYASGLDPVKALAVIQSGKRVDMEETLLVIAVAGFVMKDPYGTQEDLVTRCRQVDTELQKACFEAIVHGLFEHGIPGAEYKLADEFCQQDFLIEKEMSWCQQRVVQKLDRFRTPIQVDELCRTRSLSADICAKL